MAVESTGLSGRPPLVTRSAFASGRRAMLTDHRLQQEQWARENRQRRKLPPAFGMFIARLAAWDWFLNPLSFRDRAPGFGPPVPHLALRRITEFLSHIQSNAGRPIGWVVAEEFGRLGGRYHCHALITGVRDLPRQYWQREAYRCFGRTRIAPFDPKRGAAFYVSKYEGRLTGQIHLGGTLAGIDLSKCEETPVEGGGQNVAVSAPLPRRYFHSSPPRRHRRIFESGERRTGSCASNLN
jgi:hypothetical protein